MNLLQLKEIVDNAVKSAKERGDSPSKIIVILQTNFDDGTISLTNDDSDIIIHFDKNKDVLECYLIGFSKDEPHYR